MIPAGKFNCLNTGIIRPKCICGISPSPLNLVKSCPCEFWFDGQDAATLSLNGNKVIQWDDKSGFDRHVSNAVDAQRPTWDPVTGRVTFNNAAQTYLQSAAFGALIEPNTIFILAKVTGLLNQGQCFITGNPGTGDAIIMKTDKFNIYGNVYLIDGAPDNNDNIHAGEFNGINSNYWINGVLVVGPGNAGAGIIDEILIGGLSLGLPTYFIDAEIMETFGYNCLLTPTEHSKCFDYINNKWSLGYVNPW